MIRLLGLTLALLLIAAPAGARQADDDPSTCGGRWSGDGSQCTFVADGDNLQAGVSIRGAGLAGGVTVRIDSVDELGARHTLLHCAAAAVAGGGGGCGATTTRDVDPGTRLYCVVTSTGDGRGNYDCSG